MRRRLNVQHPTSSIQHPASNIGFTLLELVVVLVIVGMAFSLVLPAIGSGLRHWRLRGAAREVVTLLKFTRNQAVVKKEPFQVILDRSRNLYWLDKGDAPVLSDPDQADEKGIRLYALPNGVRFGEVTVDGSNREGERVGILFFPRGSSTGGEVQILDERGKGYRIRVDPVTGHARIAR
ncbi:MAG: GspH/FimT family protein [Candidatus Methylomirabilales bacterium]